VFNSVNYSTHGIKIHCVSKTSPFYLCDIFVKSSDSANFWQKHAPGNLKQTHCTCSIHISFYMFVLYLVKTCDASERTQRRRPLLVRLLIKPECRTFCKSLFKLLTYNLYQKIHELTYHPQKCEICVNFLSKCELQRRLIAA